jgi:hypothetical protein
VRGDHFSADAADFIELLANHGVRYLLVGGEAVIYHGYPRLTGDVDFWFEQTPENAERLFAALKAFWDGHVPNVASAEELLVPGLIVQFGRPPNRIDLIASISAVDFETAWARRIEEIVELGPGRRPPIYIIAVDELLRNKRATGRHKDLDDVEHLESIRGEPPDSAR